MIKQIPLFGGRKTASIDLDLYIEYEQKVHKFGEHTIPYLEHVLDLTEDMSEEELSKKLTEALEEDIMMMSIPVEVLRAALNGENVKWP